MKRKVKRVYRCQVDKCWSASCPDDCYGADICDQCKLCTLDGMVVKEVQKDDIVYEVDHVSADEIILFSPSTKKILSISPDTEKFSKEFKIIKTEPDYRKGGCPPEFQKLEDEINKIMYERYGIVR